ncbi:unnamed protein product [Camellia sinensis]
MATISTDYNIQMYPLPWIDSIPETPVLVKIHMTHVLKLQLRTPRGNININYPTFTAPDFQDSFTIPYHFLSSIASSEFYIFHRLYDMGFDRCLCDLLKQHIIDSIFDLDWFRFGNPRGIQVTARFKLTTTTNYDQMVSMLAEEVVIMEDGGGSVQRRRGVSKATIDGLKKVVVFNGGGDDEKLRTCAVFGGIWGANRGFFHALLSCADTKFEIYSNDSQVHFSSSPSPLNTVTFFNPSMTAFETPLPVLVLVLIVSTVPTLPSSFTIIAPFAANRFIIKSIDCAEPSPSVVFQIESHGRKLVENIGIPRKEEGKKLKRNGEVISNIRNS